MPITITDNTITIVVEINEIPDKYIRVNLKDIVDLTSIISLDAPDDSILQSYILSSSGHVEKFMFQCKVNLMNINFVSELMTYLDIYADNITHDYVEDFRKRQSEKKEYPNVTIKDKKIVFENLLPSQEQYLKEMFNGTN